VAASAADSGKEQAYYGFSTLTWHLICTIIQILAVFIDHVQGFSEYDFVQVKTLMLQLLKNSVSGDEKLKINFMWPEAI